MAVTARLITFPFAAVLLASCSSVPSAGESSARDHVEQIGAALPSAHAPRAEVTLPELRTDASPAEFARYAVLRHPAVAAAYFDWQASVAAIAPARALPDPQFTFQADITDTLMTFMPGLMFDFMAPGKRAAMGREAIATSDVVYRNYVATVLRVATDVRKAWIELAYATASHQLYATTIATAEQAIAIANADYTTGRDGMGNFEKQLRLQNVAAQHHAHHAALAERIIAARAHLKSALGLAPADADPPWPDAALALTPLPPADEIWRRAEAGNADLAKMRAMVDMAVAGVEVARRAGTPDFSVGAMADFKASPLMFRPTATLTLPIWREKIAANLAAAAARRDAATARVSAEQLNLAAELAQMLFMARDAERMLDTIDRTALPNLEHGISSLEAGAQSGMSSPLMIADVQLMIVDLRHERLDALRDHENAVTDLLLLMADVAPAGAPLLTANSAR